MGEGEDGQGNCFLRRGWKLGVTLGYFADLGVLAVKNPSKRLTAKRAKDAKRSRKELKLTTRPPFFCLQNLFLLEQNLFLLKQNLLLGK